MKEHYSVRRVDENGRIANEAVSWHDSLKLAEHTRDIRMSATGEVYIVVVSREEALRRSSAILDRCEKARLPAPEPELEVTTSKRTITIEIACSRWHCDGCHLLDSKEKLCDAFSGEHIVTSNERYLRCDPCLRRDQFARANPPSEVCTGCDYLQTENHCGALGTDLASIWRACEGRISLRGEFCRLHRQKVVKGQRESEE